MSKLDHYIVWILFGSWIAERIIPFLPWTEMKNMKKSISAIFDFQNTQLKFNDEITRRLK